MVVAKFISESDLDVFKQINKTFFCLQTIRGAAAARDTRRTAVDDEQGPVEQEPESRVSETEMNRVPGEGFEGE